MNDDAKTGAAKAPTAEILKLDQMVDFQDGSIVSREIMKSSAGTITLFAFDAGQGLSEHTAPFDAMVTVLEGKADIIIDKKSIPTKKGETVIMPANIPHAIQAEKRFKMLLVMVKEK